MIKTFQVGNFCSFADLQTISFDVGKAAPHDDRFVTLAGGARLSKILGVFGPNASGKTRLLMGLTFLSWFASSSFQHLSSDDRIPFHEFIFKADQDVTRFAVEFVIGGTLYHYLLVLTTERIIEERLRERKEGKHYGNVFHRTYLHELDDYDLKIKKGLVSTKIMKSLLRQNATMLSSLRQIEVSGVEEVVGCFLDIRSNVDLAGKVKELGSISALAKLCDFDAELKDSIENVLVSMDLGLKGISIAKKAIQDNDKKVTERLVYGVHEVNGRAYTLPFVFESDGTKELFKLLGFLFPVLRSGGVAVVDEFDLGLHPVATEYVVKLFISPESNPNNAQLIISSHDYRLLDVLDKTQILLVEKNQESLGSEVYRVSDIKNVRRDENLYAKYFAGAYGALPIM